MKFDIVTIFPQIIEEYINVGIINQAIQKGLIDIEVHDLRKWTTDTHKSVDDKPYGGGPGMIMKIEPIYKAIEDLKKKETVVCITTPKGEKLNQGKLKKISESNNKHYIIICGRYEGVDQRVHDYLIDWEFSIGEYILSGGELPALVFVDGLTRLLPGVLGNAESLDFETFNKGNEIDYPQYTRPEDFNGWKVPDVLLSGNHKKIRDWREINQ